MKKKRSNEVDRITGTIQSVGNRRMDRTSERRTKN